jgi:hypothetical protein
VRRRRPGSPGDGAVDQAVAPAAGGGLAGEAEAAEVVGLVGQAEVAGDVPGPDGAGGGGVALQDRGLLGRQPRRRAELGVGLAGCSGVTRVGVGASARSAGQVEQLGPQRRQDAGRRRRLDRPRGGRVVHGVEVGAGLAGGVAADAVDQAGVADAQAEQEPVRVRPGEVSWAAMANGSRGPGAGDPGGGHRAGGGGEREAGVVSGSRSAPSPTRRAPYPRPWSSAAASRTLAAGWWLSW